MGELVSTGGAHALWARRAVSDRRREALRLLNERDLEGLAGLLDAYMKHERGEVARSTKLMYARALALLLETEFNLIRLGRDEAVLFVRGLEGRTKPNGGKRYKPATVELYRSALTTFYEALLWADAYRHSDGQALRNPFRGVRVLGGGETLTKVYSDVDLRLLLSAAPLELELLIFLGAHAGLRPQEIVDLSWESVDLRNRFLYVVSGKGRKSRGVPLTNTLHRTLSGARHLPKPLPFKNTGAAGYALRKLCEETLDPVTGQGVGYRGRALHALRRHAGRKMYEATKDIIKVALYLGHATTATTERYIDLAAGGFDGAYLGEFEEAFGRPLA